MPPNKRLMALTGVALLTATAAAACGGSSSGSTTTSSSSSSGGSSSSKGGTVAFIPGATGVGFYDSLEAGAKAEATKLGYSFSYQGSPDFTAAAQTPIVNAVCGKHPKVLLIAPTDPVALRPAIQTCMNDGVKVVTVDTNLTNTQGLVSAITSDNIQGGASAADVIGGKLGGHGQVAALSLDPTATTQVERVKGFKQELASKYPGIKVVATQFTGQAETASETDARAIISAHPQVAAFFGAGEPNAEGSAQVVSSTGKKGKISIVGYDADPAAVSLLKSGVISALVIQQPAMEGQLGVEYANDVLTGKTSAIKKSVLLPNVVVTTSESSKPAYTKYYYPAAS